MKYLDRILERLRADGHVTSREISESKNESDTTKNDIQTLLHIIGESSLRPSLEYENLYYKWTRIYGFGMDMLTLAAQISGAQGKKPLPGLDDILTDWLQQPHHHSAAAKAFMAQQQAFDTRISAVFDTAGIPRRITDAHRRIYARWHTEWGLGHDAILLAAEISTLSDNPYRYLNSILKNWHEAVSRRWPMRSNKHSSRPVSAPSQRASYERPIENCDHLAEDLFADEGA